MVDGSDVSPSTDGPRLPRSVMLVIDDDDLRAMTAVALEFAGFRVLATASLDEATAYDAIRHDIVIADLARERLDHAISLWNIDADRRPTDTRFVWVADALADVPAALQPYCAAIAIRPVGPSTFVKIAVDVFA